MNLTYIDSHVHISGAEVFQHTGLIQEGQVGHVICLIELGWIHLLNVILLYGDRLKKEKNRISKQCSLRHLDLNVLCYVNILMGWAMNLIICISRTIICWL